MNCLTCRVEGGSGSAPFLLSRFTRSTLHPVFTLLVFLLSFTVVNNAFSDEPDRVAPTRVAWQMDDSYQGPHQDTFQKLKWDVPILMRQTMINVAVKLGMHFEEGWQYPLIIDFVDLTPPGMENALAYVQLGTGKDGIAQHLSINISAYDRDPFNFEKVFAHELVHAMINDAVGAEAAIRLPVWLHEGLAVFGADQGEQMAKSYVYQTSGWSEQKLLLGLENHRGGISYAEDYWAIKYINEKHGSNSLHNFVREIISRKGDIPGALDYTCSETWDSFQKHAREFSKEEIKKIGPAKWGRDEKPY